MDAKPTTANVDILLDDELKLVVELPTTENVDVSIDCPTKELPVASPITVNVDVAVDCPTKELPVASPTILNIDVSIDCPITVVGESPAILNFDPDCIKAVDDPLDEAVALTTPTTFKFNQ